VTVLDNLSSGRRENLDEGGRLVEGDVSDPAAVADAIDGVAGVFHLAAIASVQQCNEEWRLSHVSNMLGTVTVMEAAKNFGTIPVVYASSAAIYGNTENIPIKEEQAPSPMTAYGADKLGSELHARVAQLVHGVRTVGLRPFNVYGHGQDPSSPYSGVISIFTERMKNGDSFLVHSDGLQTRDFVYVGDAVRFFLAAMALENNEPEVFNISTGHQTSLVELIEVLGEVMGRKADYSHGPTRAGDIRHSSGSVDRARDVLGVTATTSLRDGLRQTLSQQILQDLSATS